MLLPAPRHITALAALALQEIQQGLRNAFRMQQNLLAICQAPPVLAPSHVSRPASARTSRLCVPLTPAPHVQDNTMYQFLTKLSKDKALRDQHPKTAARAGWAGRSLA